MGHGYMGIRVVISIDIDFRQGVADPNHRPHNNPGPWFMRPWSV